MRLALVAVTASSGRPAASSRTVDRKAASSVPGTAQARAPERAAVAASQFAQVVTESKRAAEEPREGPGHVVAAGDDLWTLAERYYDDGREWRRIVAANPHLAGQGFHVGFALPRGDDKVIRESRHARHIEERDFGGFPIIQHLRRPPRQRGGPWILSRQVRFSHGTIIVSSSG